MSPTGAGANAFACASGPSDITLPFTSSATVGTACVCVVCGEPANYTQRLVQSRERVLVGAQNAYEARCRACFDPTLAG